MRATEAFYYKNVAPGNTAQFVLYGGIYQIAVAGTFTSGNAQLFELGPDGATWLTVSDPFTANGGDTIYLPPGRFRWTVTTDTLSVGLVREPGE